MADGGDGWVQGVAARAANLSERLAAYRDGTQVADAAIDSSAVKRWKALAALGDDQLFERRLHALGLERSDLPQCLAEPVVQESDLPSWCDVLTSVASVDADSLADIVDSAPELLPELTGRFVAYALKALMSRRPELAPDQATQLRLDLATGLQLQLARLLAPSVAAEFADARIELVAQGSADPWRDWMTAQQNDGLIELWVKYPALARLVATAVELWISRSTELLARALADSAEIARTFGTAPCRLNRVVAGLSDPHNGGATVLRCTFRAADSTDVDLIYKPRDIHAEVVFAKFGEWMNSNEVDVGEPVKLLPRDGYGWVQYVANEPATSDDDIELYFRRCGALAAMLFALGATDCTSENLVAAATRPTIIDAETLLQPRLRTFTPPGSAAPPPFGVDWLNTAKLPRTGAAAGDAMESVLDTLLLPRWMPVQQRVVDLSAMGTGDTASQPSIPRLIWRDAGTADAHLVLEQIDGLCRHSDLRGPSGEVAIAHTYRASVLEGFDEGWAAISERGGQLFANGGPLAELPETNVRVLLRMTGMYVRVIDASLDPSLLTTGLCRSLHLERMARYWLNSNHIAHGLAIADAERDQAEIGDVPIFTTVGSGVGVTAGLDEVAVEFDESPSDRARRRIAKMSFAERERQRDYIRAALAVAEPHIRTTVLARGRGTQRSSNLTTNIDDQRRREACSAIITRIMRAVQPVVGGANLMSLNAIGSQQWAIAPMDPSLGHGTAGLALGLLAAGRSTGDPYAEALAHSLLRASVANTLANLDRFVRLHGSQMERGLDGVMFGWSAAMDLAATAGTRNLLQAGLDQLEQHLPPVPLDSPNENTATDAAANDSDAFVGGLAGRAELLRTEHAETFASPLYAQVINTLATRTVGGDLALGVPIGCPVSPFGLNYGLAGVLYALAAASPDHFLPSLPASRLTD